MCSVATRLVQQLITDTQAQSIGLECIDRSKEPAYRAWGFEPEGDWSRDNECGIEALSMRATGEAVLRAIAAREQR